MNKQRLDYLDMAKGIGMLFVLLGHLQGDPFYTYSPYIQPMCVWIFSFHMPMFFIVSGILMSVKDTDKKPFAETVRKRFNGIMVPYYWFSLFYIIYVLYYLFIAKTIAWETVCLNLWYVVSGYGMNVLWFLPALFLGEIAFVYLKKKFPKWKTFITVVVLLNIFTMIIAYVLTLPNQDVVLYKRIREFITVLLRPILICGFITIGYYAHQFCNMDNKVAKFFSCPKVNKDGKISISYRVAYILIGLILMLVCQLFAHVNNGIDVRTMVLRNIFFFLLCALCGSFGLIIFCKGLPRIGVFVYWGTGSLIFMATHNLDFVLAFAIKTAMYVNQYLTRARGYICYAIIVCIILCFSSLMIFVIQKYLPFIIGKKRQRKQGN